MSLANKFKDLINKQGRKIQRMDIQVYDKIAARYGDNQPRGGVVFNAPVRFKDHELLVLDAYGRGDVANIQHQGGSNSFAAGKGLREHGYWNAPMPFPSNIVEVIKSFKDAPRLCRLGCDSDPFAWLDRKYKITQEILAQLKNSPIEMLLIETRSDLVASDEYLALLLELKAACIDVVVCMHRPTFGDNPANEHLTQILEPGAASIKRRAVAIEVLKSAGIDARWTNDQVVFDERVHRALGIESYEFSKLSKPEMIDQSNVLNLVQKVGVE